MNPTDMRPDTCAPDASMAFLSSLIYSVRAVCLSPGVGQFRRSGCAS